MEDLTYGLSTSKEDDQTPIEVGEDEEYDNEKGTIEMNIDN